MHCSSEKGLKVHHIKKKSRKAKIYRVPEIIILKKQRQIKEKVEPRKKGRNRKSRNKQVKRRKQEEHGINWTKTGEKKKTGEKQEEMGRNGTKQEVNERNREKQEELGRNGQISSKYQKCI